MQVKVITDISTEPVTSAEIVNYIKLDESIAIEDALIDSMIKSARKMCEKRTNLAFTEKTLEAVFTKDELSYNALRLPYAPHAQIISIYGMNDEGVETLIEATNYWHTGNVVWEVQFAAGLYLYEQYRVTYIAGYGIAEESPKLATEDFPEEAKTAIMKQVASWYDNRDDYVPALSSEVRKILDRITLAPWF
jgi:uncharacterized phiE125 gp8 family phage protein